MTNIVIKLQFAGIHSWPECPIPQVSYLKTPHRHIFHITCKKKVNHTNRDVEIIKFKSEINSYLQRKYYSTQYNCGDFKNMSCEMIAEELLKKFDLSYCLVLEDNENGGEVYNEN